MNKCLATAEWLERDYLVIITEGQSRMLQLIYTSAATQTFTEEDLKDLLATARRNNEAAGVSGMLVYHEGSFLQILEGEEGPVMKLFEVIEKDERHDNVKLLLRSEKEERSFGDWKMGFFDASGTAKDNLDGFADFFRDGRLFADDNSDRAKAVLLQFREGSWRQQVNVN